MSDEFAREVEPFGGTAYSANGSTVADEVISGGRALQQIKTSYATAVAVQKPREIAKVTRNLLEEARLAGEDFYYGWGKGDNAIEGPSHDLAVAAARCWGNCATEMLPIQDTKEAWVFTAAFIDLETGYTRTRQFRQSKNWMVYGKMDDERKADVRFQIGQSKAERNVILKALPPSLIRQAMEQAKAGVRARIEEYVKENGIAKAVDLTLNGLKKLGVTEAMACEKMGRASKTGLTIDDIVILRGDLHAIDSGQERVDALFGGKESKEERKPPVGRKVVAPKAAKPVEEAPVETVPEPADEAAEPETAAEEQPEPERIPENEDGLRAATILSKRIDEATGPLGMDRIGKDMASQKEALGQYYDEVLEKYQAKFRELNGAGKPKAKAKDTNF